VPREFIERFAAKLVCCFARAVEIDDTAREGVADKLALVAAVKLAVAAVGFVLEKILLTAVEDVAALKTTPKSIGR
jgi:hypothetical protein